MSATLARRIALFLGLAGIMAVSRLHHFSAIPDASWAVFFAAGFALRGQVRWAFPLLMVLAVVVDYVVISQAGTAFWAHYCMSPGYAMLVPAYFVLWSAGAWLAQRTGSPARRFAEFAGVLLASVVVCLLISQGGFYWATPVVAEPTVAGWWKNYTDWFWPYLSTTGLYLVPVAAALALWQVARGTRASALRDHAR